MADFPAGQPANKALVRAVRGGAPGSRDFGRRCQALGSGPHAHRWLRRRRPVHHIRLAVCLWLRGSSQRPVCDCVNTCAQCGVSMYGILMGGLDRHVWDIWSAFPQVAGRGGVAGWAMQLIFLCSLSCTKTSVLLFFLRLLDRRYHRRLYRTTIGGIGFIFVSWLAFTLVLVFDCEPIEAVYKSMDVTWPKKYTCMPREPSDVLNGITSIFTDIYSCVIPALTVHKLHMKSSRKVLPYAVLCCGIVVVGAGVGRTFYMAKMYTDSRRDISWVGYDLTVWSSLELYLALICACAPGIKSLVSSVSTNMGSKLDSQAHGSCSKFNESIGEDRKRLNSDVQGVEKYEDIQLEYITQKC
ncbi:hypothetical protein, variant 2 [Verruconis gallopava]|uniref:Rhodopsin domain-containing protein n=1 Tax=Verruconis gallopava TaxID=253628 RepID=A0A0D1YR70_9PEZI|nr:hypothetical protein, variant 2 [Verruconis gallopava]KIW03057.1 hypothetical protein, variant 2 [Verruconis gallopava]